MTSPSTRSEGGQLVETGVKVKQDLFFLGRHCHFGVLKKATLQLIRALHSHICFSSTAAGNFKYNVLCAI